MLYCLTKGNKIIDFSESISILSESDTMEEIEMNGNRYFLKKDKNTIKASEFLLRELDNLEERIFRFNSVLMKNKNDINLVSDLDVFLENHELPSKMDTSYFSSCFYIKESVDDEILKKWYSSLSDESKNILIKKIKFREERECPV